MKKLSSTFLFFLLFSLAGSAQAPVVNWQKSLGGSANDLGLTVAQTADGGYIMSGNSESTNGDVTGNHGALDAWLVKLDAQGAMDWQKTYGGSDTEFVYSIKPTPDGGYIFAGQTSSNDGDVSGNHGDFDFWVVKLAANGS